MKAAGQLKKRLQQCFFNNTSGGLLPELSFFTSFLTVLYTHSRNKFNFSIKIYFSNNWALFAVHSCLVFIPWSQGKLMSLKTERNSDIKYLCKHEHYENLNFLPLFRGNTQFVQKVTFETLMNFKQNHHRSWKITYKSCYFQKFS